MKEQHAATQAQRNKLLRKKRTMRYFIDAASEIIGEEGVSAINIRNVAARAGYSSAALYKHFENVNQLIAFAAINSIRGFMEDLAHHIKGDADPLEMYFLAWYFFVGHALKKPDLFSAVFVQYGPDVFSFLDEYYGFFPEERKELPRAVRDAFFAQDSQIRNLDLLRQCAKCGYIRQEDILPVFDALNAYFIGFLDRGRLYPERHTLGAFMAFMRRIFLSYSPKLAPEIEKILSKCESYQL